jgi:hypothetical protein
MEHDGQDVRHEAVRSSFTMVSNAELDWQCPSVQSNALRFPKTGDGRKAPLNEKRLTP